MLNEQQIQQLPQRITYRLEKLNEDVLKDLGERIKAIGELLPSDAHKLQQLQATGADTAEIQRELARITALNESEIYGIFEKVARDNLEMSKTLYFAKGLKYVPYAENIALQRYVKAMAKQTADTYINMSRTTGFLMRNAKGEIVDTPLSKVYREVIDRAVTAVSNGTSSYQSEMKRTIEDLADSGMRILQDPNGSGGQVVDYKSGYHRRLDTSVRQNILWGVKQCNQGAADLIGEEIGADGYEISYHRNPRPTHADMGGKQFVIGDAREVDGKFYRSFEEYAEPYLSDYGCLHFKYSIIVGISPPAYSEKQLAEYKAKDEQKFEFEGKEYNGYEATQLQRRLEASMRNSKDRYTLAKAAGNEEVMAREKRRQTLLASKYNKLSKESGLPSKTERMRVYGKGSLTKSVANSEKSGIINTKVDFYVGSNAKALKAEYAHWIGQNRMAEYLNRAESDSVSNYIRADYRKSSFIGDGGTADARRFEIETGLNLGRNQNTHEQKVDDLKRQIDKLLKTDLSYNDRSFLEKQLNGLKGVSP